MKKPDKYRVLLMCKACDKVYTGTMPTTYEKAMKVYASTIMANKDVCKNEDCGEDLVPVFEKMPARN